MEDQWFYHTILLYIGTTNFNTTVLNFGGPTSETIEHWKSLN